MKIDDDTDTDGSLFDQFEAEEDLDHDVQEMLATMRRTNGGTRWDLAAEGRHCLRHSLGLVLGDLDTLVSLGDRRAKTLYDAIMAVVTVTSKTPSDQVN